jgi:hypothetical protein
MNVNWYLGTAASIGKFLGKVGAYFLIGCVYVFKVIVSGLIMIGRCIVETFACASKETQRILKEYKQ